MAPKSQAKSTGSRKLQAMQTKRRIFKSAVALMEDQGYHSVTIQDISHKAGVSVGAFYHYYNSKTDILLELYVQIDDHFEVAVEPLLKYPDVFDNIRLFMQHYSDYNIDHGKPYMKILYETQSSLFIDESRYIIILLTKLIKDGKKAGQISKQYRTGYIVSYLFVIARGCIYDWITRDFDFDVKRRITEYINLAEPALRNTPII